FTDMALATYSGSQGLDVTVRSLKSARPMGGVRVALVATNGETLAEGKTSNEGRLAFSAALLKGDGELQPKMLMAYGPGEDFTAMALDRAPIDLSAQGVGGRTVTAETAGGLTDGRTAADVIDGFLYADRGIYRPGETVNLVALVRDPAGKAVKDRKGLIIVNRPSGVEAFRFKFDRTPDGHAAARIVLPKSAPRGRWIARLQMEGLDTPSGEMAFSVEDFAPQRLGVDLEAGKDKPVLNAAEVRPVAVQARYLYGAVAAGLTVQGEARIRADGNPFPKFRDYQFGDTYQPYAEKLTELSETVTDGAGLANLSLSATEAGDSTQPLSALVTASVFEPGGRPVRESATLRIRTRPLYIGAKTEQDDPKGNEDPLIRLSLVALNAAGEGVSAKGVSYRIISENWDYDWYQQDGRWQWRRTNRDVVAVAGTVDLKGETPVQISRRLGWGDYRLELDHGPTAAKTVIRFASGWGNPSKSADAPDFVRLSAGTKPYGQGDTVALTLKAPYAGEAQIAVATDRLIEVKNLSVGKNGTTVRLKTTPEWGGGAYVLVSVVQPRDPVDAAKPRRAVGLIWVPLEPKGRKLTVNFKTAEKVRGRDVLKVPVEVKGLGFGQKARVTVAAVDQGILNLTKFKTPDPVQWYFGKRALGVDLRDDYGRLLDPNLGAPAALNYGGDQLGGEGLTETPIKTVALWSGVVETGMDGKATLTLPAAQFNGELRLMAVAWTDEAVGSGEDKVTVREPVVAELSLPRFLAPGDIALPTLELHNMDGAAGAYRAVIQGLKGLALDVRKAFTLATGQRVQERLALNAASRTGVGEISFDLSGPSAYRQLQSYKIETRAGWGKDTRVLTASQAPGEGWTPPADLLAGYQPGSVSVQVSYSPIRGFDPAPIAASLSRYPYGCTEQITSAAYPWLYAGEAARKTAQPLLTQAANRILDRQSEDGAFGLWRVGDGEADPWIGAFATDFLIEARKAGAAVPQSALDKALSAMRQVSRPDGWASVSYRLSYPENWYGSAESEKQTKSMRSRAAAYALYVMAKGGKGDLARLRWYHDVQFREERSPLARAQIGAALARMGDMARARSAFRQAEAALGYRNAQDWYQSPLRDLAGVIALAYEANETRIGQRLTSRLQGAVRDPELLNTQEKARLLQAANRIMAASGPVSIGAQGVTPVFTTAGGQRFALSKLADARLTNTGKGPLWRTVTLTGSPVNAPAASQSGLSLDKQVLSLQGGQIDPSQLVQGSRVIILISGRSQQGRMVPLIVDDALPAGYEIETVLSPEDTSTGPFRFIGALSATLAQEARDDRFIAAVNVPGQERFAVAYVARAVTPGNFFLPGAEARDLYRADISARTRADRTVIAPLP
ncbi:MAG: alpha-2-macroglobulin family protein, partial [Asticcacaulis sp.]